MDARQVVGRNVLRIRLDKRLSQEELADRAGFNQHYISELERGKRNPTAVSLFNIAKALGVGTGELFTPVEGGKTKRSS